MSDQHGDSAFASGAARAAAQRAPLPCAEDPATRPDAAARGILLALGLSGPVWIALGFVLRRLATGDAG